MLTMRRAKIVCTIGPATSSAENITRLVECGMDVARLNLSHGEYAVHEQVYMDVRRASDEVGRAVGVLVDLQGPKIRTARFKDGPVVLTEGATFTITTREVPGDVHEVGTTYAGLAGDVEPGHRILIDDGKLALEVTDVTETDVVCTVLEGGVLSNNKGINVPGAAMSVPALSEKDKEDLRWALRLKVDMIALSFVRSARDIVDVHAIMDEIGVRLPVIAKIEKPQAVENLDEIIRAFDGVMVARGDLGVELPLEEVPLVQKRACEIARPPGQAGHRRHAGARVDDRELPADPCRGLRCRQCRPGWCRRSHALGRDVDGCAPVRGGHHDGSDHREHRGPRTATGFAPLDTRPNSQGRRGDPQPLPRSATRSVPSMLVTFSSTGDTTRRACQGASADPHDRLHLEPMDRPRAQLALTWGVETFLTAEVRHTDEYAVFVDTELIKAGRVVEGDQVVIVAGSPPGIPGSTNALRVHRVGDAVHGIAPAYKDLLQR
jgi:pyruvate kinase